ncbi:MULTISPECIES: phage integrase central domain-containing protein [unclassified Sphingomonas]|uniref:phage integrase central domain-containing protein n=1 Tax=unclassified Sphingomonas TaxID=196159 RepID=UPI003FA693A3
MACPAAVELHAADVLNRLEKDVFPYIGSTPVVAVTSPRVLQLVRRIEDRASVETARRVRQRISAVYGFPIRRDTRRAIRLYRSAER